MPARAKHPPELGQGRGRIREVVQDVDAPHQPEGARGERETGAVAGGDGRERGPEPRPLHIGLDPDDGEAGAADTLQPVAAAAAHVEHGPVGAELPQPVLEPGVQGGVGTDGR